MDLLVMGFLLFGLGGVAQLHLAKRETLASSEFGVTKPVAGYAGT
jgi:hypothetical protein